MKLNSLKLKGCAMVLVGSLAAFPLSAGLIPGLPDIVWDPIQEGHMISALAHDLQMISQLAQEVQVMQYNIRAFPSRVKGTFQGYAQPFYRPVTGNVFGETAAWANMAAHGLHTYEDSRKAWEQSGVPLNPSPLLRNNLLNSTALNQLAHVEISDAAAITALETVNDVRSQQTVNEQAIRNLQSNCLNSSNDTQAMQANCVSATGILNAQSAQTTNALLSSVVDLSTAQMKEARDQEARRINRESKVREYQATEQTNAVFSPEALRRFRFQF